MKSCPNNIFAEIDNKNPDKVKAGRSAFTRNYHGAIPQSIALGFQFTHASHMFGLPQRKFQF